MDKKFLKIFAGIWAVSGIVILLGVLLPIFDYKKVTTIKPPGLVSPVSTPTSGSKNASDSTDYTKASNWFVGGAPQSEFTNSKVSYYTLSIPKLKIDDATVAIGGDDLGKSLVQYPGTALPGKRGNSVIFGHSILPIFYNPKEYISIFSTLPTLKNGDEIDIAYDGISFKYRVEDMFEVIPTDIQVLEQDTSDSFLTLVTCVPPGDPRRPRRLIVRARISPFETANAGVK